MTASITAELESPKKYDLVGLEVLTFFEILISLLKAPFVKAFWSVDTFIDIVIGWLNWNMYIIGPS